MKNLKPEQADVGGLFVSAVSMIGAVSSGAKFGIFEIGIDRCVVASVLLQRGPSSFPRIPRTDDRMNTFSTAKSSLARRAVAQAG